jgi:cell division protein FtsA
MKSKSVDFVALDIGSSKISAIAAQVGNDGNAHVISQLMHSAEGIRSSSVIDWKSAENSILSAIYALENDLGVNIKKANVSLSGIKTKSYYISSKIDLRDANVTKKDMESLIRKALEKFHIDGHEIIHYFPIEFFLDDFQSITDPVGMFGKTLGCRLHVVAASSSMLLNLASCLSKCHVEISSFVLSSYASGIACLTEDEKDLGAIAIEMGARSTSFAVFLSKKMIYSGSVPVGSWHITSDIAKALSIPFNLAERLKIIYGKAIEESADRRSRISLEDMGSEYENFLTVQDLVAIIKPRTEEIFKLVKEQYDQIGVDHLISKRIVISGGGAGLAGTKEIAGQIFSKNVKIAKSPNVEGMSEDYSFGAFSVIVGMVQDFADRKHKQYILNSSKRENIVSRVFSWIKENV